MLVECPYCHRIFRYPTTQRQRDEIVEHNEKCKFKSKKKTELTKKDRGIKWKITQK